MHTHTWNDKLLVQYCMGQTIASEATYVVCVLCVMIHCLHIIDFGYFSYNSFTNPMAVSERYYNNSSYTEHISIVSLHAGHRE